MSKRRNGKSNKNENINKIESVNGFDGDVFHIIRVVAIILIVFCLFYGLTVLITKNGDTKTTKNTTAKDNSISYTDIMLGRSFSMPEEEYLVLYYDKSNSDLISAFSSAVSNYRGEENSYTLYTVDMSNEFNKKYESSESNRLPKDAQELAISGPTLIHFSKGIVVDYLEGKEAILEFIK